MHDCVFAAPLSVSVLLPSVRQVFVNEAQVNVSNIMTGKGVIHGLASVLEINRNRCDKAQLTHTMVTPHVKIPQYCV